ncbi:MAG: NAD(P)H-hydrate dehydratase [Burkholderiales bacterium]|nr:NAD(P)H-hydrate dehydratase [Phycisphaerae bacterium]
MPERLLVLPPLPARPADGHKGLFGRVLIVGGNPEMIGAPAFAGAAAFRAGAGLVQIATPKSILPFCLAIEPELIGLAMPAAQKRWDEAIAKADAIVIGPGLGQSAAAKKCLDGLLRTDKTIVIDADAINLLAAGRTWPKRVKAKLILTPHPGEMQRLGRLIGKPKQTQTHEDRLNTALRAADATGQVIILKGARTIVTDGRRVYVNDTGDSSLSKAGTGDVLTGICATLVAQGTEPFLAASMSPWIHGMAGEIAGARRTPRSTSARDIVDAIGEAMVRYEGRFGVDDGTKSDQKHKVTT